MRVPLKHRTHEPQNIHRAPSWPRRNDADDPISFADVLALPDPDWIGRDPQAGPFDASLLEPLELTDWQARIAADWGDVDAQWDSWAWTMKTQLAGHWNHYVNGVRKQATALEDDIQGLVSEQLPAWRVLNTRPMAELKAEVAK